MTSLNSALLETVETRAKGSHEFVNRRREQRIQGPSIPAQIRIGEDLASAPARILDISSAGVRVGIESSLEVGLCATVSFNRTVATGQVGYCRSNPDGSFDVGLLLHDVLNRI